MEVLRDEIDCKIHESLWESDMTFKMMNSFGKDELVLQLICISKEYSDSKIKESIKHIKHIFDSAGAEDVEWYVDRVLGNK